MTHRFFSNPRRGGARTRQAGFTLIEAVVVMVITGILGGVVAMFIRLPMQSYAGSVARANLSDTADTALRRMRRDVRLALPNSIRVSGNSLEFLMTKTGGRYLAEEDEQPVARAYLDFVDGSHLSFQIVGTPPSGRQAILRDDFIVVYNQGPGSAPADAYSGENRAQVASYAAGIVTLKTNPFAAQTTKMTSPANRFQVVTTPVTYHCNSFDAVGNGELRRLSGYPITLDQADPPATPGVSALIAGNVQSCVFTYDVLNNAPKALIGMTLTLRDTDGDRVTLTHQVHVDNTP